MASARDQLDRMSYRLIVMGACVLFLAVVLVKVFPTPAPEDPGASHGDGWAFLHAFEVLGVISFLASILHSVRNHGARHTYLLFPALFLYAFIFEDVNIQLSGVYEYNESAWMIVHNTMLVIPLGWCAIVYCMLELTSRVPGFSKMKAFNAAFIIATLALTIDLGIDATAFAYGFWTWNEGWFFGVPLMNYVGWFIVVFLFIMGLKLVEGKDRDTLGEFGWMYSVVIGALIAQIFLFVIFLGILYLAGVV